MLRSSGYKRLNICILAMKRLPFNTRVVRQALALSQRGHKVTVFCLEKPGDDQIALTPDVTYIESPPPNFAAFRFYEKAARFILRAISKFIRIQLSFIRKVFGKAASLFPIGKATRRFPNSSATYSKNYALHSRGNNSLVTAVNGSFFAFLKSLTIIVIISLSHKKYSRADILNLYRNHTLSQLYRKIFIPFIHIYSIFVFKDNCITSLKDESFDIVQSHDTFALPAAEKLCSASGATLVFDGLEVDDERSGQALQVMPKFIKKLLARKYNKIIQKSSCSFTIGPSIASWMEKRYLIPRPIIIRNCRIYEKINRQQAIRTDSRVPDGGRLVLYINKVYPGQGVTKIIKALTYLPDNIYFATLGPVLPEFGENLLSLADELGVGDRVSFLDTVPATELVPYASGADMGIIPRQLTNMNCRYSLPNRVFEFIMARLPISCSRINDIMAIVQRYNLGMVFNEVDPKDIARVIGTMLEPENLAKFRRATEIAAKELCWEKEGAKYVDAVEKVALRGAYAAQPSSIPPRHY